MRSVARAFVAGAMALSIAAGLMSYRAMHSTPRGPEARREPVVVAPAQTAMTSVAAPPATGTASLADIPPIPPVEETAAIVPASTPQAPAASAAPSVAIAKPATPDPKPATPEARPANGLAAASPPLPALLPPDSSASHAAHAPGGAARADLLELADARTTAKDHPDARSIKAWALSAFRAGALREARHAGEVWALHDDTVEPRLFLANVLEGIGHHGEAKAVLDEWLEIHPESSEARKLEAKLSLSALKAERVVHRTIER